MKNTPALLILFLLLVFVIDLIAYRSLKNIVKIDNTSLHIAYWVISIIITLGFPLLFMWVSKTNNTAMWYYAFMFGALFMLLFIPKLNIAFFTGIGHLGKLFTKSTVLPLFQRTGAILGLLSMALILYGVLWGRFHFQTVHQTLYSNQLTKAVRIVHISDLHLGSFYQHHRQVERAIQKINQQNPDIVIFSGDMVNHFWEETKGWEGILGQIEASIGKYAVLGNHDYGDYVQWGSPEEKADNLANIKHFIEQTGFTLLLNAHTIVRSGSDSIAIVGVENTGKPPFPQYGDLHKATRGLPSDLLTLLISHDPSHWAMEVSEYFPGLFLTLSGHTHGMQLGINLGRFSFSPVSLVYPHWGGLYSLNDQHLYVNRGLGNIGFPARIGMRPEITVIDIAPTP